MKVQTCEKPVSWLLLERYFLSEISPEEKTQVESHLEQCETCQSCLQRIEQESRIGLKPLPEAAQPERSASLPRWWTQWAWAAVALVAVLLVVGRILDFGPKTGATIPESKTSYKGGELAMAIVAGNQGTVTHEPKTFSSSDRFMVLLTCPPKEAVYWDVVVYQGGLAYFPLAPQGPLGCGNRIKLPGAFRIDGRDEAVVCLGVGEQAIDREAWSALDPRRPDFVCLTLRPR